MKRPLAAFLACLCCASACFGQEIWYLSPRAFHAPPAEFADIRITRDGIAQNAEREAVPDGQHADRIAFPAAVSLAFPSQIAEHVFVRGGPRQWNLHHPEPIEEGSVWTRVPMPQVGAVMIGLECEPVIEIYTANQLRAFINERAPAFVAMAIPERDNIRVRVVRCAKTLVRIDDGRTEGVASPIPSSRAGQRNEIRLNGDPTVIDVTNGEAEIPLRLYADWHSRQGVTFTATNIDTNERTVVDVNEFGNGSLVVNAAGVWRIEFHYLIDVRDNEEGQEEDGHVADGQEGDAQAAAGQEKDGQEAVDFELHSATLTLMVAEGASR